MQDLFEAPRKLNSLLDKMTAKKRNEFIQILAKGHEFVKNDLENLFSEDDVLYSEYQDFISNYPISYFDGVNIKNFYLETDNKIFILKLENHLQVSTYADKFIRFEVIPEHIIKTYCEKNYSIEDINAQVTIILSDFCENGSVYDYAQNNFSHAERIQNSISIFKQMADILIKITDKNCFFPDMKNSNWLIDINGTLYISDTKSFIILSNSGIYDEKLSSQKFLKSFQYSPDEFYKNLPIDVDKAHVAIFGKNIYQFLTNCEHNYLIESPYKYPDIFDTGVGKIYKQLIEKCLNSEPNERPSMKEVSLELEKIESLQSLLNTSLATINEKMQNNLDNLDISYFLRKEARILEQQTDDNILNERMDSLDARMSYFIECKTMLIEIESYSVSANDLQMQSFISEHEKMIDNISHKDEYIVLLEKLHKTLDDVKQSKEIVDNLKSLVSNYKNNTNYLKKYKHEKAEIIEKALCDIPISERKDLLVSKADTAIKLREAVASKGNFLYKTKIFDPGLENLTKWIKPELIEKAKLQQQQFKDRFIDMKKGENGMEEDNAPTIK